MSRPERIAITGVGAISALGQGARASWRALLEGRRGIRPVRLFDAGGQHCRVAAEIDLRLEDVVPAAERQEWSRSDGLALIAAREALADARLAAGAAGLSIAIGGTTGGMFEAEAVLSTLEQTPAEDRAVQRLLSYPLSTTGERLARVLGPVERVATVCSACSSSANAIVQGAAWIEQGRARAVLAGGTDGLCSLTFTGFNALGALDAAPCRPFDAERAGLSLGEAAAFLLLEPESAARARGARVYGWLSGWAIAAEAHHITHPEPTGETAARLLHAALGRAGRTPGEVDYVNAHGTATRHNDAMEWRALDRVFGAELERLFVSSCKGQLGHTLGAAGALEAVMTVLALDQAMLPPTGGLTTPDPALPLRHVRGEGLAFGANVALSSSFGFGGTGCVLCFEKASLADRRPEAAPREPLVITGACCLGPGGVLEGVDCARHALPDETLDAGVGEVELDAARSRRFDRAARWVAFGAERALASASLGPADVGLIAGSAYGNVERSVEFLRRVASRGPRFANPAEFPHLVPSAAAGNASIYLGLSGPVLTVSDLQTSGEQAFGVALDLLSLGLTSALVAGSAEPSDSVVAQVLAPLCTGRSEGRGEGAGFLVIERRQHVHGRGGRELAEVLRHEQAWSGGAERLIAEGSAPAAAERARVLVGTPGFDAGALLAGTRWADVPRLEVSERVGQHEAAGAMALCIAAALIGSGQIDHALVIGRSPGRIYVTELGAPARDPVSAP